MIFPQEFLQNMNYKAGLIQKLETLRACNPQEYYALHRKFDVKPQKFNTLPARELRTIVDEIGG